MFAKAVSLTMIGAFALSACALKPREMRRIDYAECRAEAENAGQNASEVYSACLRARGYPTPGD